MHRQWKNRCTGVAICCIACVVFGDSDAVALAAGPSNPPLLSVDDVAKVQSNPNWILVDARSPDAFNGWALDGVERGGHIPDSVNFSASWLRSPFHEKAERLTAVLRSKGIVSAKHVVIYSTDAMERAAVSEFLKERGHQTLYHLDLNAWVASNGTLIRYPEFHRIVPPSIVQRLLNGERPETFENAIRIKFVETSWGKEDASYAKGHVPGSFHVNTDDFEPPPSWKLGSPAILAKFAKDHGFQSDDTLIVSGEDVTACYRLAVVLQYMGVADVRVLNGGLSAWKRAGYPVETKRTLPPQQRAFDRKIPKQPKLIIGVDRVKVGLGKPDEFCLVDNRTWAEFIGATSGYKYHDHKGRIPGSVFGQADFKGPNSLSPYRNIDDTMCSAAEIFALWRKSGIDPNKQLCFFCGGGWRAAEVLTFAQVIGVADACLYSDGWIGWSNDRSNPIETGPIQKNPL